MERDTDIVNEPREEIIDADLAVGLAENGFHVYLDRTDEQLTPEKIHDYLDDYGRLKDGHTFTVPMMEVAQYGALETLCEKLDDLNDDVRADLGMSLENHANELLENEESQFVWSNTQSEWENIRRSLLSGETEYLHSFLEEYSPFYLRAADLHKDLDDYETSYFAQTDKTFAYEIGHSSPFTVVQLDVGTEERKNAVSGALKTIINSFGEGNAMSLPYKALLEDIKPTTDFLHASQGHLSALKYALRNAEANKALCLSMLDGIKRSERNLTPVVTIKGYECIQKDTWEERGVKFTIGQSVYGDMSFYYARATDGKVTRDYEYDHKPDREKVMSDHTDKLAEEDIDRGEAIYGADGYLTFPEPETKHTVENIPRQWDISHKTTHADPSAIRGESQGKVMEQNAGFEGKMLTDDFKRFFGKDDVAQRVAALADVNGITLEIHRYQEPYEERDPDRGHYYSISGTLANHHYFTPLSGSLFRENSYGLKEFQPMSALIKGLKNKIHGGDRRLLPDMLDKMNDFVKALEEYQKVENIPQQQDISHNTNADPSAKQGERRDGIMEQAAVKLAMKYTGDQSWSDLREITQKGGKLYYGFKEGYATEKTEVEVDKQIAQQFIQKYKMSLTEEGKKMFAHPRENAELSETQAESRGNATEKGTNTRFEVSSMTKLDGGGKTKAIGTLVINGEFKVDGVTVFEGKNGLEVGMPSKMGNDGKYHNVVFVKEEAYESVKNAVLTAYSKLAESPDRTMQFDIVKPEKSVTKVYAQMHEVNSTDKATKAAGDITLDGCIVVKDVKLNEFTNNEGQKKLLVAMPARPNEDGHYDDIARPATDEMRKSVNKSVIASANNIGRYEYKGVKYAELGEDPAHFPALNNKFADKLIAELDKAGIMYQAKFDKNSQTAVFSVAVKDKQAFDNIKKELTSRLNEKDKPAHKHEETAGSRSKH